MNVKLLYTVAEIMNTLKHVYWNTIYITKIFPLNVFNEIRFGVFIKLCSEIYYLNFRTSPMIP